MTLTPSDSRLVRRAGRVLVAVLCAVMLTPGELFLLAQDAAKPAPAPAPAAGAPAAAAPAADAAAADAATKATPDQLDSLVAPIALYPDPLLAQTLVASTYPLELIQLQQWMAKNPELKDKALADAVAKQPWESSVQTMAATPEVVKRLVDDIQWTTDLGNAFLDQQNDVMDAVQRMRKKAKDKGALESNEQQKVETKVVEEKTVIVVQSANPEVIYVPSYSPTVVYGPPPYPYPPIYYPPYPPGAAFVSFSFGVMMGAAIWGGSCCGCGWGGGSNNNVNINVNNNFNRNNVNNINRGGAGGAGGGNWQHNPSHRGGTPYGNKGTANKYGGSTRGDSGNRGSTKAGQQPSRGGSSPGANNKGGSPSAGNRASSTPSAGNRASSSPSASNRSSGGGGGDKVGGRSIPSSSASSRSGGFGGGSGGFSGSSARSSSSRGASSMGSRGGGGGGRRR